MLRPFIRAQWVVSLALLPLGIGFFNQSTLIGPLVNLLAIPWISLVVVPVALLGCLFAWLPASAGVLWHIAAWAMQALWHLLLLAQDQHWAGYYSAESHAMDHCAGYAGRLRMPVAERHARQMARAAF